MIDSLRSASSLRRRGRKVSAPDGSLECSHHRRRAGRFGRSPIPGLPGPFRNRRTPCLLLALLFSLAAPVSPARASFFDTFGASARGMALGNSMAAISEGWASLYYNPAALALSEDVEFSIGVFSANPKKTGELAVGPEEVPRQPRDLENITGPAFGLVVPIQRLTPKRLPMPWAIGVGVFVPRQALSTTMVIKPTYPFDVIFQERNQTLALHFGISTRITSAVYLGLGLVSQVSTPVDVVSTPANATGLESRTRFSTPSLLGGILVRPSERLRLGLVYRQECKLESTWNIQYRVSSPGPSEPVVQQGTIQATYVVGFVPENVAFGAAYTITERLRISGELTWYRWSAYEGPYRTPPTSDNIWDIGTYAVGPRFTDIVVPRIGVMYRITRKLEARAGFYYEPTPVPKESNGVAYPIGNDRFVPSVGIGYTFPAPWGILAKPLTLDAYFQYHILMRGDSQYRPINAPTLDMDMTSSGSVYSLGLELTFKF
jgi:long-chain fatty acid transport protein